MPHFPHAVFNDHHRNITTYEAALPYGVATCSIALAGAFLSLTAAATAIKVIGIFLGVIGAYAFLSVIVCAIKNSDSPRQFQREIKQSMVTAAGGAIISITNQIVRSALDALIDRAIYGENHHRFRIY